MNEKVKSSGLAWKLIVGFILSSALIGFAAWFAYQNFNKLLGSVETLSTPNNTTESLQNLVNSMHEADGSMRNFTMTNDYGAFQSYISVMEKISLDLETLKQDENFAANESTLDSLGEYFQDKADLMYSLVIFKQSSEYEKLNSKALKNITSKVDTDVISDKSGKTEVNKAPGIKQPAKKETEIASAKTKKSKEKTKEKDEGFLKNLFSGKDKEKSENTKSPTLVNLKDTVAQAGNTSSLQFDIAANPSLNVEDVRQVLIEIEREQKQYNANLSIKELEILASDKIIIREINELIESLRTQQVNAANAQLAAANQNAKRSSRIMLSIASAALSFGLVFLAIILIDINTSNRYKKELIISRNRAEYLAKAKEEFLANMSHEIRTPLNAIIGFSEQMESTPLQPSQKKYIKAVSNAGAHLLNTVNDILDLSKIEAGKLAIDNHPFKIKDIVDEVGSILEIKAREKGLTITTNVQDCPDEYVMGDSFRIKQILYNIAGNAIKFTEIGSVIIGCKSVKTTKKIDLNISVTDSGIGIAPEKLDKIFESFEQAESAISKKYGGTGLGLSISKKLAELLGGNITVISELGKGTTFNLHFMFPLADEQTLESVKRDNNQFADLNGLSILVVDDEPFNLMLAEVILKKFGANSTTASNGREALEKIEMQSFDIVLADLHMPELDGYMLANKIREKYLRVPLIALTANVMQNDVAKIKNSGFNDILLKPYKERALLEMIAKYAPIVIGENAVKNNAPSTQINIESFNLVEIKKFADNDDTILVAIIESFIQNNSLNLLALKAAIEQKDFNAIRNTAHKMLPSYNHFHVQAIIPNLRAFEIIEQSYNGELLTSYNEIESESKKVFNELEQVCRTFAL